MIEEWSVGVGGDFVLGGEGFEFGKKVKGSCMSVYMVGIEY